MKWFGWWTICTEKYKWIVCFVHVFKLFPTVWTHVLGISALTTVFKETESRILKCGAIKLFSSLFKHFTPTPQGNDMSGKLHLIMWGHSKAWAIACSLFQARKTIFKCQESKARTACQWRVVAPDIELTCKQISATLRWGLVYALKQTDY